MHGFDSAFSNVPAFLVKLWKLVEDSNTDDLISWSESGKSFIIKDQATFAKELLPQYFKHNNMASFVRQLNMYGFNKYPNFGKGGLKVENPEMEFANPYFVKDKMMLLDCIKRKIPTTKGAAEPKSTNPKDILTDLTSIREKQETMNNLLVGMKKENELLWREISALRKKHKTQEQIIQKVIQFLVSIVQSGKPNIGMKRQMARMLHDNKSSSSKKDMSRQLEVVRGKQPDFFITSVKDKLTSPVGPVIHEVTDLDHEDLSTTNVSECGESVNHEMYIGCSEASVDGSTGSPAAAESPGPLSLFAPLHERTPVMFSADEDNEQVLGLPVDYPQCDIPVPDIASVVSIRDNGEDVVSETEDQSNIILMPDSVNSNASPKESVNNTISIPDDENALGVPDVMSDTIRLVDDVTNVISIPECSDIVPFFEANSSNVKIPSKDSEFSANDSNNVGSLDDVITPELNSDIIPFSPSFSSLFSPRCNLKELEAGEKNSGSQASSSNSSTAGTEKKPLATTASGSNSTKLCSVKKDPFWNNKEEDRSKSLQLAVPESSSLSTEILAKNAFSNHVLSVEEELEWLQTQLSGGINVDSSMLLGLFSSDDAASNVALASQLTSDNGGLRDAGMNIVGNELVQFNPALDMSFDEGILDCLDSDSLDTPKRSKLETAVPENPAFSNALLNIKKEERLDQPCCMSKSSISSGPSPSKKAKHSRSKSKRKLK